MKRKLKDPDLKTEKEFWSQEALICGLDEVGRGCIAGPVVAAAVVLPKNHKKIDNVRDSKLMTAKMREKAFEQIMESCHDFGIGLVPAKIIDQIGIEKATKEAMRDALLQVRREHDLVLIDGNKEIEIEAAQIAVVDGDATVYTISCASIVAKVFRDAIVSGIDQEYPDYGFSEHKGYGTKKHYEALNVHGLISEHRKSFLRSFAGENN